MKLDYYLVNKDYRYYSKVKHLFEHAFPPIERPSFSFLMSLEKQKMYAVELDSTFIGLFDLVIYKDMVYLFFLAVKETYRHKHIGTEILQHISKEYQNFRIYLIAEDIDGDYKNIEQRKNRIAFYQKNGFTLSKHKVNEFNVLYIILHKGREVNKEEFIECMKYLLGDEFFYGYYLDNVS